MLASVADWIGDFFFGGMGVLATIGAGYWVFHSFWKHHARRQGLRERERVRRDFWGFE